MKHQIILFILIFLSSCTIYDFGEQITNAHGIEIWKTKTGIIADFEIKINGNTNLAGKMYYRMHENKVRMETENEVLVFDGDEAYVSPNNAGTRSARFSLLTWPYFLSAPLKVKDPGSHLEIQHKRELEGKLFDTAKMTFDSGVGDAPDDWYIIYKDPKSSELKALVYIVTYFGTNPKDAKPSIAVYENYTEIEGVRFAQNIRRYDWNESIISHLKGEYNYWNIRFENLPDELFERPKNSRIDAIS